MALTLDIALVNPGSGFDIALSQANNNIIGEASCSSASVGAITGEGVLTHSSLTNSSTTAGEITGKAALLGYTLGSELTQNGTFDDTSWWTIGGGWTISDGVATSASQDTRLTSQVSPTVGNKYRIEFDIVSITGTLYVVNNYTEYLKDYIVYTTEGHKIFDFTATSVGNVFFQPEIASDTFTIDNVSIKEKTSNVLCPSTTDGDLTQSIPSGATSGATNIDFSQTALLRGSGLLSGTIACVATTAGAITGVGTLAASSLTGNSTTTGEATGKGSLSSSNTCSSVTAGEIIGTGTISASFDCSSVSAGNLSAKGSLIGSNDITFTKNAILKGIGKLSSQITIIFTSAASAVTQSDCVGSSTNSSSTAGSITGKGDLNSSISESSATFGTLIAKGVSVGSSVITFSQSGNLKGRGKLLGQAPIIISSTGFISEKEYNVIGESTLIFSTTGYLRAKFIGSTDITFTLVAAILLKGRLRGINGSYVQSVCKEVINHA